MNDPNVERALDSLSSSGGPVTGFNFTGVGNGIYHVVTRSSLRYLVVRDGEAQSFGGPTYDLSYLQRGNKDLRDQGFLNLRRLPLRS
jgi:hypothetical protein